jgi:hypothetical protein
VGQRRRNKKAKKKRVIPTDWKELEKIVARIQQDIAPDAKVTHDDKVLGKSGRLRQLDVTLRQKLGVTPIFVVIECKRYSRLVSIEKVEQFAKKLQDVGASRGVMVSNAGFDAGARAIALQNDVLLHTYREAQEADWKRMIETVSVTVYDFDILNIKVSIKIEGIDTPVQTPIGARVFSETGQDYVEGGIEGFTVKNFFWNWWDNEAPRPRQLGPIEARMDHFSPPAFAKANNVHLLKIQSITLAGTIVVTEYRVPLSLVSGEVLEDSDAKKLEYISVHTNSINTARIRESHKGVELTQGEWNNIERRGPQGFSVEDGYEYRLSFIGGEE